MQNCALDNYLIHYYIIIMHCKQPLGLLLFYVVLIYTILYTVVQYTVEYTIFPSMQWLIGSVKYLKDQCVGLTGI